MSTDQKDFFSHFLSNTTATVQRQLHNNCHQANVLHSKINNSNNNNNQKSLLYKPSAAQLALGSIFVFIALASCLPLQTEAFQYDIWFKFPHPHTQTDPINYCTESVRSSSPTTCQASTLPVYVNTLDSPKTLIPYQISQLLDFCVLQETHEYEHSPHTEWDDNIRLAPFDIKWQRKDECKVLCKKTYKMNSATDLYRLEELKLGLTRDYYHHWFADTFPFSWCYKFNNNAQQQYSPMSSSRVPKECFIGFPIGYTTDERGLPEDERVPIGNFTKPNAMFLFNHFDFTIYYESGEGKSWSGKLGAKVGRVSGLRISPRSINHEFVPPSAFVASAQSSNSSTAPTNVQQPNQSQQVDPSACSTRLPPLEIPSQIHYGLNATISISYSYSVRFVEDDPANGGWARRWYRLESVLPGTGRAKWVVMITVLLLMATSIPAAYAIARTIFADRVLIFVNPRDEGNDEAAWKSLAGDIFREPIHIATFSVLVGSGCQFIATVVLSELFSIFLPLISTTLLVIVVLLFVLVHGFVGGFAAIRLYRTFGGEQWRTICCLVTLLNPLVILFLLVMSRNLLLLYNGSLMALNAGLFGSLFGAAICFAVSVPSALAGGNFAFRMSSIEFPVRPTANQRELPEQLIWRQPALTTALVAFIPLICIWCVEAYPFSDNGGYFITVITILIVVCLSISHCYLHLSQYDYRWWWRSYLCCGLAAIYYFVHCAYYIFANLYVDTFSNALLYLAFVFFICLAVFLLTGTIGFAITFAYLWQTYARTNASPNMNYAMFQKGGQIE